MTENPGKLRSLSIEQITKGIEEVAEIAQRNNVAIVLVGGVAMGYYGSDRLTGDLDFAATGPINELPSEGPLTFGGYQSHTPSGIPVDLILRNDDYREIYEEAILNARQVKDLPVPIVAPEYLAAMKLVARRRKDELDLEALLELGVVDTSIAKKLVKRLLGPYAADDLKAMIEVAEWKKSRKQQD